MCQLREHLARIFFPAHCTCMNFFWHDGLVQEFFSYAYALAGYFVSKSPTPPPQKLNGRPLITAGFHFKPKIACTKASIRSLTHIVFTYLSLIITSN